MKDRIRSIIRDRRQNLPEEVQKECAGILCEYLEDYICGELKLDLGSVKVVSYMPARGEISSLPFCRKVLSAGGSVYMPKVAGDNLGFYKVDDLDKGFVKGAFGISEPDTSYPQVDPGDADVIIVPAIAYNDEGIRLGQGGGFYDRLYESLGGDSPDRKSVIIGVCYDFQIVSSIPVEANDMAVDVLMEVSSEI